MSVLQALSDRSWQAKLEGYLNCHRLACLHMLPILDFCVGTLEGRQL